MNMNYYQIFSDFGEIVIFTILIRDELTNYIITNKNLISILVIHNSVDLHRFICVWTIADKIINLI